MTTSPSCDHRTPLSAAYYADGAEYVTAPITLNERMAEGTYRLRFTAPTIAAAITPGQFVMLRLAGINDPLLGRALALYDVHRDASGAPLGVEVVYLVHGKLTSALASAQPGDQIDVWGPLGNGFGATEETPPSYGRLIQVAGGIGQTPFLALGKEALGAESYGPADRKPIRASRVTLCYGVRRASLLAGEEDFRGAGIDLRVASDDGSVGHHGLVTDLLTAALDESADESVLVACCGPEPMMEAVAEVCRGRAPLLVSLETPMACGFGACFSCVAKVVQPDGEWDYKRTCVEGPVFDAENIVW